MSRELFVNISLFQLSPKVKASSPPKKGGGHIIDSFALSSFGGVGGGFLILRSSLFVLHLIIPEFVFFNTFS